MGFPIRSNIFKQNTPEQRHFAEFPIQVSVVFSPNDSEFVEAFKEIFLHLDRITGDAVIFFAVLDPPQDWLDAARQRRWWSKHQQHVGQLAYSMEDRVLVGEIARLFELEWHDLPGLVVSTNLWSGEFLTTTTSVHHIERQLQTLTDLVKEWGQPNIGQILDALRESFGFAVSHHEQDLRTRNSLSALYGFLEMPVDRGYDPNDRFHRRAAKEVKDAERLLGQIRPGISGTRGSNPDEVGSPPDQAEWATARQIDECTGRLIAPATVAERVYGRLVEAPTEGVVEVLEDDARVMIETALRVGQFLERHLQPDSKFHDFQLPRGRNRESNEIALCHTVDFTPGAQGIWKAFELEVNLSVIQAARAARTIRMPELFSLYDPKLPKERAKVTTVKDGKKTSKSINQEDYRNPHTRRHLFLMLGDGLHVTQALAGDPAEDFDSVVARCLGGPLPESLLKSWETIHEIRNHGSHVAPLLYREYKQVLEKALSDDTLDPLVKIKKGLSGRD